VTNAAVCPYCRGAVDDSGSTALFCPACGTPHHADCYEENGGCSVFGCTAAPPSESKLSIEPRDLLQVQQDQQAQQSIAPQSPPQPVPPPPFVTPPPPRPDAVPPPPPPAPPMFSSIGYVTPQPLPYLAGVLVPTADVPVYGGQEFSSRDKTTFLILGALLGAFGAHSFYAGSTRKGAIQLAITLLTLGIGGIMVWIWAIIDICTITTDSSGLPFRT